MCNKCCKCASGLSANILALSLVSPPVKDSIRAFTSSAFISAYALIVILPWVVPVSVVLTTANSSADSSHTKPTFVSSPRSIIKPASLSLDPV